MSDELSLLKEIGSNPESAPVDIEQRLRRQLLDHIATETGGLRSVDTQSRGALVGWRMRIGVAVVAAVLAAAAVLVTWHGGEPSIADKAYAAIAPRTGIMHFVAEYPGQPYRDEIYEGRSVRYDEYWIDLAHPRRMRIVATGAGRVLQQLVFVDHPVPYGSAVPYGSEHGLHKPLTTVIQAPRDPGIFYHGSDIRAGKDPIVAYRELLRSGFVVSEQETTYRGRDAYELVIQYKPPYDLVDDVWTGDRQIYVVDRQTYFPLESTLRLDPTFGGYVTVMRYLTFEILSESPQTRALLKPVRHPQPYRP